MKKCYTCKRSDVEFNKNKAKKDGLNSICKDCSRKRSRLYYKDHKAIHIKNVGKRNAIVVGRNRKFTDDYKSERGCKYCPEKETCCLQFHHLGDKDESISVLVGRGVSIERILKEINKCEVVCANCHFKIHNAAMPRTGKGLAF